ncbi:hypothetical protein ACIRBY_33710 [Streptomyces sp. NPDC096136]|uniref:hypothetical protein n=1 Tax=Streptomyces sp. NPDC096136 TaxID=3366076 RepID=UPI0037F10F25
MRAERAEAGSVRGRGPGEQDHRLPRALRQERDRLRVESARLREDLVGVQAEPAAGLALLALGGRRHVELPGLLVGVGPGMRLTLT